MGYQYVYAYMSLIFLIIWTGLYFFRKDNRKEMVVVSFLFGFAGVGADMLYTKDWWTPLTLTNTSIGIESFIVGFCIAGIASVLYEDIFKKKIKIRNKSEKSAYRNIFSTIILMLFLFFGIFYFLNLNSFISTIFTFGIPVLLIYFKRKDLIVDSITSGILMVFVAFVVYGLLEIIAPGWVEAFWHFTNVPNIIFLNVPIDDLVWYFLAGALIGPLYEFWHESKIIKNN